MTDTIDIFFVYAQADKRLRNALENHLSALKQQGVITSWDDQKVLPGQEWEQEATRHLRTAHIILLLVSPGFLASDFVYGVEFKRAMERHHRDEATVIPVIVRPVDWKLDSLRELRALPAGGKPVTSWRNRDEAFLSVAEGIREVVENIKRTTSSSPIDEKDTGIGEKPHQNVFVQTADNQGGRSVQLIQQALKLTNNAQQTSQSVSKLAQIVQWLITAVGTLVFLIVLVAILTGMIGVDQLAIMYNISLSIYIIELCILFIYRQWLWWLILLGVGVVVYSFNFLFEAGDPILSLKYFVGTILPLVFSFGWFLPRQRTKAVDL